LTGDGVGAIRRAAGEEPRDLGCEARPQLDVLAPSAVRIALALADPGLLVRQALPLGVGQGASSTSTPWRS
jgi:hypothetical protein